MKQTKEQRELNTYTRSDPPNYEWEQDFLEGEGGGVYTDELQTYRRLAKRDKEVADWYHEFNKTYYAMGGWDTNDQEDKTRRNARRSDVFTQSKRTSLQTAVDEIETGKDIQV